MEGELTKVGSVCGYSPANVSLPGSPNHSPGAGTSSPFSSPLVFGDGPATVISGSPRGRVLSPKGKSKAFEWPINGRSPSMPTWLDHTIKEPSLRGRPVTAPTVFVLFCPAVFSVAA